MKVVLCSYGDVTFQNALRLQRRVAESLGFEVIHFTKEDLESEFLVRNSDTLELPRGAGYWVWKPQVIRQSMDFLSENDVLLYLDAGALPRKEASFFLNLASNCAIHLWQPDTELNFNKFWIDDGVARYLGVKTEDLESGHYWAGAICSKVNENFRGMIDYWQELCETPNLLRPDSAREYSPQAPLIWHRHDQSLLNLIVLKRKHYCELHPFPSKKVSINQVFTIHRRGALKSQISLRFFLLARAIKRLFYLFLPKRLQNSINNQLTRARKPYITENEWKRLA